MLETTYAGIRIKNPVIVASATPTMSYDAMVRSEDSGAGALVTKSVVFPKEIAPGVTTGYNPRPRFILTNTSAGYDHRLTLKGAYYNSMNTLEPYPTPEEWAPVMEKAKKKIKIPIVVSICAAEKDYAEWQRLAKRVEDMGADAIECSMHHMPFALWTDPAIIKALKEVVKIPVVPKPMAATENPVVVARNLEQAGSDGITVIGTQPARGVDIDVEQEKFLGQPTYMNYRGPWSLPIGLNWAAQTSQTVKIPVSGVSGIEDWRGAVKYILVGCSSVQICTGILVHGYRVVQKTIDGLEKYMKEKGYSSIEDFRGKLLPKIVGMRDIVPAPELKSFVRTDLCNGCKACTDICCYGAISYRNKKAEIDQNACDGCGLCYSICPARAIEMRE